MNKKKIIIFLLLALVFNFTILNNANPHLFAGLKGAICEEESIMGAMRICAYVIRIIQIVAPAIIIITCISSGFKMVITEEDGGGKQLAKMVIEKFCIAAFIVFIPIIVSAVMESVSGYDKTKIKFSKCMSCLNNVEKCK